MNIVAIDHNKDLYNTIQILDHNQYVTRQKKITRSTNKLQFQTYSTTNTTLNTVSSRPQTYIGIWNSQPWPAIIVVPSQSFESV